jgi:MoaA/NifB/PqqE/SkfB family radical SAM enzyme
MKFVIEGLIINCKEQFESGFIAESPEKIRKIYCYYAAFYGLNPFPYKKCNAPWVSAVVEADGSVRPCFFHPSLGNIHKNGLDEILNSKEAIDFRKNLDIETNKTCVKCVCYLNLPPGKDLSATN